MRTNLYLHASKESNYEKGQELGLLGEPLELFTYACYEVKVTVEVNAATGAATIVAVDDKPLVVHPTDCMMLYDLNHASI